MLTGLERINHSLVHQPGFGAVHITSRLDIGLDPRKLGGHADDHLRDQSTAASAINIADPISFAPFGGDTCGV
jgi:hypothetical protein